RWGDPAEDAALLDAVRRRSPEAYRGLLTAHAARRTGRARYVSLQSAAVSDDDTGAWIRAAAAVGALPEPGDFPGALVSRAVVDAMVLGLLREGRADLPAFESWLDEGPSAEVAAVAEVAGRPDARPTAEDLARPEVAVALDRAGLLTGPDFVVLDPHGHCPGSFALVLRRRPTEELLGWLLGLGPGRVGALGLHPASVPADFVLAEDLGELRRLLRPPLPRGPGARVPGMGYPTDSLRDGQFSS
ncbi:hypothetical protein, partial [Kitasatospora sp. NPDC059571]|uniref:hypothetical protein n=1 Tax=Kitasatospora sp. NPDC059571 TaxID=3346871 RepID=UPI0036AA6BD4